MANCGIYRILNTRNGKMYIGSTDNFTRRKNKHFRLLNKKIHPNAFLQNAFNKEPKSFIFEVLLFCCKNMRLVYEQIYFDAWNPEYNLSLMAGRIEHTPEVRKKISNSLKGKPSPRKGKIPWNKGIKTGALSQQTKEKISDSLVGRTAWNKGIKTGKPAWNRGRFTSEEIRLKISLSKVGKIPWNKGRKAA